MVFLTFNDLYSGIYKSQVIDVVNLLNEEFNLKVKLVAFVPRSLLETERKKIKAHLPDARVFPITFGLSRWKWMSRKVKKELSLSKCCIARGPLACSLALKTGKKTVYDGRAAVKAEVEEYNITGGSKTLDLDLIDAEIKAVNESDFKIAVSYNLVNYWRDSLGYSGENHVVIPCTLSSDNIALDFNESNKNEVKIVYSGGVGPWQSFDLVVSLLEDLLSRNDNIYVKFMTKPHQSIEAIQANFPDRVKRIWVDHKQVFDELAECDYGILIRENKVTNQVASPVKFAEYLSAGLKVLVSDNIGDYSELTIKNDLGILISDSIPNLHSVNDEDKRRLAEFAQLNFSKSSNQVKEKYSKLVEAIS